MTKWRARPEVWYDRDTDSFLCPGGLHWVYAGGTLYRPTTLKTVMGEVEYQRHVYLLSGAAEQPRETVYLPDKSMGLDSVGLFSDTVCTMAVEAACAVSYRRAAAELNGLTGLNLSHESVWRIAQNAGSWEQARVDTLAVAAKAKRGAGTYETSVLYEEMDGAYLALQGKDRQEYGSSREMKASMAYSGICEDASGRRSLASKVSYASMEQAEHFRRHAEGVVAGFYKVKEAIAVVETSIESTMGPAE